jgi:aminoglycoside phosphotransferase family enzyme
MHQARIPGYVQYLLRPSSYPHRVTSVDLVQTHISYVLLTDDYVYKWKKPVDFGFVDFSTLAKRKFYCDQELILNRRLCSEIYLKTVWLARSPNGFHLQGTGEKVEYGVKMMRMPEDGMMDLLLAKNSLSHSHLETIVTRLVPFYQHADSSEKVRLNGRVTGVAKNIEDNFIQTTQFVGSTELPSERFAVIQAYCRSVLQEEALFKERIAAGRIRDCHGDLHSGNICFGEVNRVYIFDCIEFNDALRHIDICADVAFLAMDLDYHGEREMSEAFIAEFIVMSGDTRLPALLNFYKCYRAYVRGKVNMLAAVDPALSDDEAQCRRDSGASYFRLAEQYARNS